MRLVAAVGAVVVCLSATVAVAQGPPVSSVGALKAPGRGLTLGPDGALWHTSKQAVGVTTASGRTTEQGLGKDADASSIVGGPDGALWFIHHVHAIGHVTIAGALDVSDDLDAEPHALAAGPDGNVWFTAKDTRSGQDDKAIGRITPKGAVTIFGGNLTGEPLGIVAGSDGALWFTEPKARRIGRITTGGTVTEFAVTGEPDDIAAGPDGALWFTDPSGAIGRIATDGRATRFAGAGDKPGDIAAGPDGALWYTLEHGVGRIGTDGAISTLNLGKAEPVSIAPGPDSAVYFTDAKATTLGRIGVAAPPTATPSPQPTPSAAPTAGPVATAPVPQLNQTLVVAPQRGRVRVRRPGGRFTDLEETQGIPVGSVVDARHGAVDLQSATATGRQTGRFSGGLFAVRQRGASGHTDLYLRGRLDCNRSTDGTVATVAKKKRRKRKVWGSDSGGDFSTHGRDSVTTVRGTRWLTQDTCRGTLTRVTKGEVVVRDLRTGKRHVVRAGGRYLARHRP